MLRLGDEESAAKINNHKLFNHYRELLATSRVEMFYCGSAKQERIIETASLFMQKNNYDLQPRFDVAEVTLGKENEPISCEYIENAFDSSF